MEVIDFVRDDLFVPMFINVHEIVHDYFSPLQSEQTQLESWFMTLLKLDIFEF